MSTDRDGMLPYRRAPLGTNALKRLGEAIASGGELTADHRDLYEAFIRDADQRRAIVQSAVSSLLAGAADQLPRASVAATGRTKTLKTLREKLIRSPHEKLPSIRDVAGVRIVADCSILEQRVVAGVIGQALSENGMLGELGFSGAPQLIDRLETPMHGYRALHLAVRLDNTPVEIQIRTALQHSWAALMELLCDRWGREPRYGEPLVEPDPELRALKMRILDEMDQISLEIAEHEEAAGPFGLASINLDWSEALAGTEADRVRSIVAAHPSVEPALVAAKRNVQESLARLRTTIAELDRRRGEKPS
ncbi:hypothetical protein [Microbacterium sp. K2]|uniref:hypothetical protein n=1 Tax=Microbacterium sp. K2 TaxID=3391827 RepID=UPI003ED8C0AF